MSFPMAPPDMASDVARTILGVIKGSANGDRQEPIFLQDGCNF
jgi:hypothetical protein